MLINQKEVNMLYDDLTSTEGTWLCHHGIKGMRWGIRRYQNEDGTLTAKGIRKYEKKMLKSEEYKQYLKDRRKLHEKVADTRNQINKAASDPKYREYTSTDEFKQDSKKFIDALIKTTPEYSQAIKSGQAYIDYANKYLNNLGLNEAAKRQFKVYGASIQYRGA